MTAGTSEKSERLNENAALLRRAGYASVSVALLLVVIKLGAWWASGAVSVLTALLDSLMDGAMALLNLWALRLSLKPADEEHRYGHGKIEGVAGLGQAAFVAGSGLFLLIEIGRSFFSPRPIAEHAGVIVVMLVSIFVTFALTAYQRKVIRKTDSLIIRADQAHYKGDLALHASVILALLADRFLGWNWADLLTGGAVALWLLYTSRGLFCNALDVLMDKESSKQDRETMESIILDAPGVLGFHDLRTRKAGSSIFISFDAEVCDSLSLTEAHDIAKQVEYRLLERFPNAEILIHIDPKGYIEDTRHSVVGVHM